MGSSLLLILISIVFIAAAIYLTWLVWRDMQLGQTFVKEKGEPKRIYFRSEMPLRYWLTIGSYILSSG